MRHIEYAHVLKPSVEYLERCGRLMLDAHDMAEFLGVPVMVVRRLVTTDRLPRPLRLGLGNCTRWSLLELLEWVEAGCPRRGEWIEMQRASGRYPQWRWW